jgi:O-antigen ligase
MSPAIATVIYACGILGLFLLDRDRRSQTSKALWLPVVWLLITCSRAISEWLQMAPLSSTDQYLEGSPLDRAILSGLVAIGVAILVHRRRKVGRVLRENRALLVFLFYCALSILWSDYPYVGFKRWIKSLGDFVMVLIVLTDLDPAAAIKRLFSRPAFVLLPLSILFIKYYPDWGRLYSPWDGTQHFTGVTNNKNLLGMICLLFGLASLWRFLQELRQSSWIRKRGPLLAHGVVLAIVLWLFWMANSITPLSCFILAGGLMAVTSLRGFARKPWVVHLLAVSVLTLAFSALFLNIGSGLVETMGRDSSLTGRTQIWDLVLNMHVNPLFGAGFESFWLGPRLDKIWAVYWFHPTEAHNGYLETFLNLGWVGIALLAVVIVAAYRNVAAVLRRDPEAGRLRLAFFVSAIAYNFTESAFKTMNPVWFIFLLAAIAVPKVGLPKAAAVEPLPASQAAEEAFVL